MAIASAIGDAVAQAIAKPLVDAENESPVSTFWIDDVGDRIIDDVGDFIVFKV